MTTDTNAVTSATTTDSASTQATEAATTATDAAASTQASTDNAAAVDQPAGAESEASTDASTDAADGKSSEARTETKAPEKYEFKDSEKFAPAVLDQFKDIAKELDLPQEAAQKLLETMGPKIAEVQQQAADAIRNQWAEAAKTDKEFGGDKLQESLGIAKSALEKMGTPELVKVLNETGLGNNPEVIRMLVRVGKSISEASVVNPEAGAKVSNKPAEKTLYPNMN